MVANTLLDLEGLRLAKKKPGMGNLLARTKTELWSQEYARHRVDSPNGLLGNNAADRSYFLSHHQESITNLNHSSTTEQGTK